MSFFFAVFYDPNDPISAHMNGKRVTNSKSAHQITPGAQKPEKMTYDVNTTYAIWRKFQALKRYGTQISFDMTLEIRSQVKGHSRYGLFREGVKLFKGYVYQVSWQSDDSFASYSRKTRVGLHHPPPPSLCRRGLSNQVSISGQLARRALDRRKAPCRWIGQRVVRRELSWEATYWPIWEKRAADRSERHWRSQSYEHEWVGQKIVSQVNMHFLPELC